MTRQLLPRQTPDEIAEQARQDVEEEISYASSLAQQDNSGDVNSFDWTVEQQNTLLHPTDDQTQHVQHMGNTEHVQHVQPVQTAEQMRQFQHLQRVHQRIQHVHGDITQQMQQPDTMASNGSGLAWDGAGEQAIGNQSFNLGIVTGLDGSASQNDFEMPMSPRTVMPQNGLTQNGLSQHALSQSMLQNGMLQNGMLQNGMLQNDMPQNGMPQNGMLQNGLQQFNFQQQDQPQNGLQQFHFQQQDQTQNGSHQFDFQQQDQSPNGSQQYGQQQQGQSQHDLQQFVPQQQDQLQYRLQQCNLQDQDQPQQGQLQHGLQQQSQPQYGSQQHDQLQEGLQQQQDQPQYGSSQHGLPTMETVRLRQSVPLTAPHDGNFRFANPQDNTLQQRPTNTAFAQQGQAHTVAEGNVSQPSHPTSSVSPEGKVAITPLAQQSRASQPAALAPNPKANLGPCTQQVYVPPRPKPGRKPLPQEDAQDRRRIQNRMAQRNFRDKRAQKVSELTADNDRIRRESADQVKMLMNRCNDQKERNHTLIAENERLKKELLAALQRADDAEREAHSRDVTNRFNNAGFPNGGLKKIGSSTTLPMPANMTRPVDHFGRASSNAVFNPNVTPQDNDMDFAANEIDMSSKWNSIGRKSSGNTVHTHATDNNAVHNKFEPDNQWLSTSMDVDRDEGGCGFCTDESNCACIESKKAEPVIAPGGCDACVRDPERAAACKALAEQTEVSQRPALGATNNGNIEQRNDSMAPPPGMMSCSSLIDRIGPLGPQRMPSIAELFPGKFHSYPSVTTGSGYDVNEQEAAQVLQSMSRRNTVGGAAGADL